MANAGRFFCVGLPLVLVIAAIIFTLVGTLAGVADKSLYLFTIDVTDLSIDPANLDNLADKLGVDDKIDDIKSDVGDAADDVSDKVSDAVGDASDDVKDKINDIVGRDEKDIVDAVVKSENITAADLGLSKYYDISLWGYCRKDQDDKRHCVDSKFNWASERFNKTYLDNIGSAAGVSIDLPDEIRDSLEVFSTVTKYTEIAFIVALVALGIELVVGILANFSRVVSCITWLLAGIAALLTCAAAALATAMASIVVGTVEGTAKFYGVKGEINTKFLAIVWIGAAFAVAAPLFWLFTMCCCKPEHRSRSGGKAYKHSSTDGEKLLSARNSSYSPLGGDSHHDHHDMGGANSGYYNHNQSPSYNHGYNVPQYPSATRSDLAYEPYSHRV